jgi:hypothetical protein
VTRNGRHGHLTKVHGDPQGWQSPPSLAGPVRSIWDYRRIARALNSGTPRQRRAALILLAVPASFVLAELIAVTVDWLF